MSAKPKQLYLEGNDFPEEPGRDLKRRFLDHVRDTADPESFPGICTYPVSCDEPYVIIAEFQVDAKRRPNCKGVACAICSPDSPKFLDGRLVYHPRFKRIRLIGHNCAEHDVARNAEDEYRAKVSKWNNEQFLIDNINKVPMMLAVLDALKPSFTEAARLAKKLRSSKVKSTMQRLRTMRKQHGCKLVVEVNAGNRGFGPSGFKSSTGGATGNFIQVGTLSGGDAPYLIHYNPISVFEEIRFALDDCNLGQGDDAILKIADLDDEAQKLAVEHIRSSDTRFKKEHQHLIGFTTFFTRENFKQINLWGQHDRNNSWVNATLSGNLFEISSFTGDHAKFQVNSSLYETDIDWPVIKEIT